jgi:hypothetical protein
MVRILTTSRPTATANGGTHIAGDRTGAPAAAFARSEADSGH